MAKKIVQPVEVQASVKGDSSVKSFKAQIKEAQQEALRLAAAFGETDARTLAAAQRVAQLKDRMDDVNATIAGLHPDRFQRIANITGTLANGFAAAQGAAALLGSEGEDLQRAMVRVQGAMALAQGISGLKDLQFMFAGLGTTITTKVLPSLATLRGALIATGIGAIVVAVGMLAANWDKVVASFRRFVGLPDWEKLAANNKAINDAMDRNIEILEAREVSEKELTKARIKRLQTEYDQLREISRQRLTTEEEQARIHELLHLMNLEREKAKTNARKERLKSEEDAEDKALEKQKEQEAERQKIRDKEIKAEQDSITRNVEMLKLEEDTLDNRLAIAQLNFEKQERQLKEQGFTEVQIQKMLNAELKRVKDSYYKEQEDAAKAQADKMKALEEKAVNDELKAIEEYYNQRELQILNNDMTEEQRQAALLENTKARLNNEIQARKDAGLSTVDLEKQLAEMRLKTAEDEAEKVKTIEKQKLMVRQQAYADAMTASSALIELIGQETAVGKAIALAQIAADTGVAISHALKNATSPLDPANPVTGGLAGVAKFAAISAAVLSASARAVKIVQTGKPTGGGGGSMSMSGGGAMRPSMPSTAAGLPGGSEMAGGAAKVFVTESDISATQGRVKALKAGSVI